MVVDIPITDSTTLAFDGRAVNRSVTNGCGNTCGEYPVSVSLTLELQDGSSVSLRYALNYGDAAYPNPILDKNTATFKQRAFLVPQDQWVSNSFRIRDEWPTAVRLSFIQLISNGWDYEGYYDNISIGQGTLIDTCDPLAGAAPDDSSCAGLDQDQQTVLFTEFTRLAELRAEGYGLGLSIVRRIVERLGGQVGVESAVGQGSEFYFTLPVPSGDG